MESDHTYEKSKSSSTTTTIPQSDIEAGKSENSNIESVNPNMVSKKPVVESDDMNMESTSLNVESVNPNIESDIPNVEPENAVIEPDQDLSEQSEEFDVLKALANKLGAVITLFTELDHCWVIPIFPEKFNLHSPHFFVVYRFQRFFAAWLGNKASVSSIRNINIRRQGKEPQCRCGRGTPGKTGQGRCVSKEDGKYLTRCICFRLDRGCGDLCDCRGCENPFGQRAERPRVKKMKVPYRQRYAHEAAKIATCKSSSVSNTNIATQTPSVGGVNGTESDAMDTATETLADPSGVEHWVPLEHCIFEALINEIKSDENLITPDEVQRIFNEVVTEVSTVPDLTQVAHAKTVQEISCKLQQRERDVSDYLRIYQMQVDLSLG